MYKSLSKREYEIMSELALRKKKAISLNEAKKLFKIKKSNLYVIFYRLEKKKWLERIERGKYLIVPLEGKLGWSEHPFVIASRLVKNYYISYRSALSYYGLTEQLPNYVYIATIERKHSLTIKLQNYIFKFIKIKKNKFFGFTIQTIENNKIRIAEKEKAIVDCLDQEKYAGTIIEITKALSQYQHINMKKVKDYAIKLKKFSIIRRLGYILDLLNKDTGDLKKHIGTYRPIYLSTTLPKKEIEINKKWKLIINVKKEDLLTY